MAMIKIDGAKIKTLREEQGLTQLYLATAVQVTTDTISRWENKRYPTIKKENGLKLAETLNVPLEELLLAEEHVDKEPVSAPALSEERQPSSPAAQPETISAPRKWPVLILAATLSVVVAILGWLAIQSTHRTALVAERIVPEHCIAGQLMPVLIKVSGISDHPKALIIKEQAPKEAKILKTFPTASSVNKETNEIKWLGKVSEDSVFAYTVKLQGPPDTKKTFTGYAALNKDVDNMPEITGNDQVALSAFHWADTDSDNVISDKEILAVYDRFADFKELEPELDLIEEIWLGSGYRWDSARNKIEILD